MSDYRGYLAAITTVVRTETDYTTRHTTAQHEHNTRIRQLDQQHYKIITLHQHIVASYALARKKTHDHRLAHLLPDFAAPTNRTPVDGSELDRLVQEQNIAVEIFIQAVNEHASNAEWAVVQHQARTRKGVQMVIATASIALLLLILVGILL